MLSVLFLISLILSACGGQAAVATPVPTAAPTQKNDVVIYTDSSQPVDARVEDLLKRMNIDEKIGQMTQVEKNSIQKGDITKYYIGSILSGGGGSPANDQSPKGWYAMVASFQKEATETELGIPLIYGVDAVHGHGNLKDATIFPHNIGLGAANDPDLTCKIAKATAEEMLATGIPWNFSPVIAVPQDVRWGRTYEGYSEDTSIVANLGAAYVKCLQAAQPGVSGELGALATPKHFIGDGGTTWGSSTQNIMNVQYMLDQGDTRVDEATLRKLFLPPYKAAVDSGAMSIMASFSSWNGEKVHSQKHLITDILKGELGFKGFVVSDWGAIDQINPSDYYTSVVTAINSGVDMNMVPTDYVKFISTMKQALDKGDITQDRVDDAVRRILRVKFMLGLFEHPMPDTKYQTTVRSPEHLDVARQVVRESLVLLKNENNVLPLNKKTPVIFVAGDGAYDLGLQTGGWTLQWQGQTGTNEQGTTIYNGLKDALDPASQMQYNRLGDFSSYKDVAGKQLIADVGIVVLAEQPYAEGVGDATDIALTSSELKLITDVKKQSKTVVVILLSGRPRVITDGLPTADAWVAAWLPGTEGEGIADVLFGDYKFTGKTAFSWPRSNKQLPINVNNAADKTGCDAPLFPFGYGLTYGEASPQIAECNP